VRTLLPQDNGFVVVFSDVVMVDCTQGMDTCIWELCSNYRSFSISSLMIHVSGFLVQASWQVVSGLDAGTDGHRCVQT